jgi:hypothetical protein
VRRAICITNNFMTANYAKAFIAAQEMLKNERAKPWKERRTVAQICRCVRLFRHVVSGFLADDLAPRTWLVVGNVFFVARWGVCL